MSIAADATTSAAYQAGRADALDEARAFALASAAEFRGLAVRATIGDAAADGFRKIWENVADHIGTLDRGGETRGARA